jgi:DNA-directed RNA polymerase I and III subunit RPAC1
VIQTGTVNYSGAYVSSGLDNSLDLAQLKRSYRTEVQSLSDDTLEMDLVGIDPAIANAYRRILISEVPTMAIDKVFIANNTSIMQVSSCIAGPLPAVEEPGVGLNERDGSPPHTAAEGSAAYNSQGAAGAQQHAAPP